MTTTEILLIISGITTSLLSIVGAIFAGLAMLKSTENGKTIAKVDAKADALNATQEVTLGHVNSAMTEIKAESRYLRERNSELERQANRDDTKAAILADAKATTEALQAAGIVNAPKGPLAVTVENPQPVPVRVTDHKP